jgi:hypothetical protein
MPNNPSSYFYHRSLHNKIGEFPVDEHYVMDYDFLLKAFRASKVVYVDQTFGNYRLYADNKTSQAFRTNAGWENILRATERQTANHNLLYRLHMSLGIRLLRYSLLNPQPSTLSFRAKRRLMLESQKMLDRVIARTEKYGG